MQLSHRKSAAIPVKEVIEEVVKELLSELEHRK
jgi:hypothetical protein